MITLRPYQADLDERVCVAFRNGVGTACLQLGTGGGKTATSAHLLQRVVAAGYRAAFLAHLDSLIEDTHERLTSAGVPAGFVQAGRPSTPDAPVQVCSTATLHARGELPPADLVILDECHRAPGPTVRALLERYSHANILGLTATPQRGDGQPLGLQSGGIFRALITGPSNRWLTEQGYLVPCDVLAPGSGATNKLACGVVDAYREHADGTRAIVFASSVAHARQLHADFVAAGYTADVVIGETSRQVRRSVRARLRAGELQVLIGVGVFIEGWDEPSVETVILARAFGVTAAFLQGIGRGLRPSPSTGKTRCTVLDLRGAVYLHGLPDEDRIWSLDGTAVRRAEVMTALRKCRACLAIFRPTAVCPRCGARSATAQSIPRVLSRAERLENLSALSQAERDWRYLTTLLGVAQRLGKKGRGAEAWALAQFRKRFKRDPEGMVAA